MNYRQLAYTLLPDLEKMLQEIANQQFSYTFNNINVFTPEEKPDVFLGGKLINISSYLLKYKKDLDQNLWLNNIKIFIDIALSMKLETWGIVNFILGLQRFKELGVYNKLISPGKEEIIKKVLDWRTFVNESDLTLINKPTNYYGVAFAIACYRHKYFQEDVFYRNALLEKLLTHIKKYSSNLVMDETAGQGRFDRYSCLIPGELASYLDLFAIDNQLVLTMLKQSSDIFLDLVNSQGHGFVYGRSIGVYGDTSALEVLSIAAINNLLSEEELKRSYCYFLTIVNKYVNFWIDQDLAGINMWEKGRRTDSYRFKGRCLGENFSTLSQIFHTLENLEKCNLADIDYQLEEIAKLTPVYQGVHLYRFNNNDKKQAMAVIGVDKLVLQLPFVNGASSYFDKCPYFPVPQTPHLLEMPCDRALPLFYPFFTLPDNKSIAALANFSKIKANGNSIDVSVSPFVYLGERKNSGDLSVPKEHAVVTYPGQMDINYKFASNNYIINFAHNLKDVLFGEIVFPFKDEVSINDNTIIAPNIKIVVNGISLEKVGRVSSDDYHCNHGAYNYIVSGKIKADNFSYQVFLGVPYEN